MDFKNCVMWCSLLKNTNGKRWKIAVVEEDEHTSGGAGAGHIWGAVPWG